MDLRFISSKGFCGIRFWDAGCCNHFHCPTMLPYINLRLLIHKNLRFLLLHFILAIVIVRMHHYKPHLKLELVPLLPLYWAFIFSTAAVHLLRQPVPKLRKCWNLYISSILLYERMKVKKQSHLYLKNTNSRDLRDIRHVCCCN